MKRRFLSKRRGFTLLEILVALAVFSVIGVLASRILFGMTDVADTTETHGNALAELQRALYVIERDVEQLAHRSVRDAFGQPVAAVSLGHGSLIELTRHGWQNPLAEPRTELQRVAYMHQDDTLVRVFWPVLDRAPNTEPVIQVLLTSVFEVAFVARDDSGHEHRHWPPPLASDDEAKRYLAAIELRLGLDAFGWIERLWLVALPADFLEQRDSETSPEKMPQERMPRASS